MNDAFPNPCKPGKCPKPYVCNRSTKTCKNKKGKSRSKSPSLKKSKGKSKSLNKSPIKQTPNVFTIAIITIYRNSVTAFINNFKIKFLSFCLYKRWCNE